ncbi:MAG: hypothetical protein Q7U04_07760 [Bacteriovorax sp.]|nr:hypothetical protein [Bacteriovorax sp.]
MNQSDLSLDLLLQETLALTEYLRVANSPNIHKEVIQHSFLDDTEMDVDYLYDLADSLISDIPEESEPDFTTSENIEDLNAQARVFPEGPGVIYKIDNGSSTFCVRGYSALNIRQAFSELDQSDSTKRIILKLGDSRSLESVEFFEAKSFELAESIREQIINRRFPHQEDALCNLSDPGFSWWMNIDQLCNDRFEIFFRSHGINRADKYIQLGPIGDGAVAALRMNQARTLLRSSFPISEFSCDDKSFAVASSKPDHLSFISFKNIFLEGVNLTELENFPDNGVGRTLYYYFHELALVRKFWIEVKTKLG